MGKERTHNLPEKKEIRRVLRTYGTVAEASLWRMLRNRQVLGTQWRRQFSIGPYILDFYCPQAKLCIELDGQTHYNEFGQRHDNYRDEYLKRFHGIRIIRFENKRIWERHSNVLREIEDSLKEILGL